MYREWWAVVVAYGMVYSIVIVNYTIEIEIVVIKCVFWYLKTKKTKFLVL